MAISTIKKPSLIPTYTGNIDTYNGTHLFIAPHDGAGTRPQPQDMGNRFLILSDIYYLESSDRLIWGIQIAIGFKASKIAIRNSDYDPSGGTWSTWRYIEPS